jgi:hypothetical protein
MNSETNNNFKPVLLSKSELRWLSGDIKVSKSFEYKIRSSLKQKIQTLTELELPLLVKNNFFVNDGYHHDIDDDGRLGRDLESGPPLSYPSNDIALVRQRSRVQIPAKAYFFCKKEEELSFFLFDLPYTVFHFLCTVFDSSHNEHRNCCNSNRPSLTMIFLQLL